MNKHNGFVTCGKCKCVTRRKKTYFVLPDQLTKRWAHEEDLGKHFCFDQVKCDLQLKIRTERDRLVQAALRAREDRDMERQMGHEMKAYFGGAP